MLLRLTCSCEFICVRLSVSLWSSLSVFFGCVRGRDSNIPLAQRRRSVSMTWWTRSLSSKKWVWKEREREREMDRGIIPSDY